MVEDEPSLSSLLSMNLTREGYDVQTCPDGREAIVAFDSASYDLILLDVMLSGMSGWQVCEYIRMHDKHTPILFLTARGDADDRIKGLKIGGDDYLTKPFVLEELLLRIKNLLLRQQVRPDMVRSYTFGNNQINFDTHEAVGVQGELTLTKIETRLLKMLIDHKNEVLSRKQILQTVWGYDIYPTTRTIDNFILAFRKYFESNPKNPQYFKSVRGVGYKFVDQSAN